MTTDADQHKPASATQSDEKDFDIAVAAPAAAPRDTPMPSDAPHGGRLAAIAAAQNPLLEAARPLLRALADLPQELQPDLVPVLNRMLEREVLRFQSLCHTANIRHEHVVAASYSLCTALDEAAQAKPWSGPASGQDVGVWATRLLTQRLHGDAQGGEKFFLLVGRLAANPQEHADLLELMYLILGLGFEGRYAKPADGPRQLTSIRHRLLGLLAGVRGEVPAELSPNWRGAGAGRFKPMRSLPVWVSASVLGLTLVGLFGWYKFHLGQQSTQLEQQIAQIGKRQPPPAAAPAYKALRLKALLADEIARGTVNVDEDDSRSAVSFKGDDMFVPGRSTLTAKVVPALRKVAAQVVDVTGTVVVTGHTDNLPIRTREFPNNQVLSEKRAQAVAEVLLGAGVAAGRVRVEGRGDTQPLADNASFAGRAKNRRVDITVTQSTDVAAARSAPPTPAAAAPVQPTTSPGQ